MRLLGSVPLAAAILLAACGDGAADDDGAVSPAAAEKTEAPAVAIRPRPGLYRAKIELIELDAPDMPAGMRERIEALFPGSNAAATTFCVTEEEAARDGAERMLRNLAQSDCPTSSFTVAGNTVVAELRCAGESGITRRILIEGQMTAEKSTVTIDQDEAAPDGSQMTRRMRVTSERVGDCPA